MPSDMRKPLLHLGGFLVAAATLSLSACERDEPALCEVVIEPSSLPDRHLIGVAEEYVADPTIAARQQELAGSQRARREVAWSVIARVLAPTTLQIGDDTHTTPAFRTYYDRDDFARTFNHLYEGLTPEDRVLRTPFSASEVNAALAWNVASLRDAEGWDDARWLAYLDALDTLPERDAVGGIRRMQMSPGLVRHLAASYPEVVRCLEEGRPPAFIDRMGATRAITRTPIALPTCTAQLLGPYFAGSTEHVRATLSETAGSGRIELLRGASPTALTSVCEARDACEVDGPGAFFVRVTGGTEGIEAELEVSAEDATEAPAGCLAGAFPPDALSIAAEWRRVDPALPLRAYDTSAAGLQRHLDANATWGEGDMLIDPSAEDIYTVDTSAGTRFRLVAFHIRAREVDQWVNITVFWSPRPEEDFGADRPAAIRDLGGPWSNYAMCATTELTELDPDPYGGFATDAPSLGEALAVVHEGVGGPTWCSNPFIDAAPGLARGNCIGCHQHAMGGLRAGEIALDPERFPNGARLGYRNNAPADGFWGLDAGDDLATVMRDAVLYFR